MSNRLQKVYHANHQSVKINDTFWSPKLHRISTTTVWDILNKFESDHEEGITKNYEWVIEGKTGRHIGPPWYDGLICEMIRGNSDIIAVNYDKALDDKIEFYTSMIEKAQATSPDGYLNTYTTLICPDQKYGENGGSILWQHETYNIGCLVEAGVHYYKATKKTKLLACAVRAANCFCRYMGEYPKKNIVPAHSLAEEAMVKLYRLLKDNHELCEILEKENASACADEYLRLAKFWMDHRGVHHNRASLPRYMGEYAQDHCPIEFQSEAVGHAVRAALMYTGLAAVGMETGEAKYLDAAKRLWDNVVTTKLHISGGIGAVHNEEKFAYQYELPNDAYLETCAGVAFAFWAGEMHCAFGDAGYMDAFECSLYNNILPALSADGTHYFYENPLISDGSIERWVWHACPCCPPMFMKIMGALHDYIYSYSSDSIYINLHIGSTYQAKRNGKDITITQTNCTLPFHGTNEITVSLDTPQSFDLMIRKPAWSGNMSVQVNGEDFCGSMKDGYFCISRTWNNGDTISVGMELPIIKVEAHPYVDADNGRIALMRGPLLYCLEQVDNPEGTDVILDDKPLSLEKMDLFGEKTVIKGLTKDNKAFTAVPYFIWCNRGKGTMHVWVRQFDPEYDDEIAENDSSADGYAAHKSVQNKRKLCLDGWEGKLYRAYQPKK